MMIKKKILILTFFAINLVTIMAAWGALRYYYSAAKEAVWTQKMQSGQRELREIGSLLEHQLASGILPEKVIGHLQLSIQNTDMQSEFICMYNTEGIELCHPDPSLVGMKIEPGNSRFSDSIGTENFDRILRNEKPASGFRDFPESTGRGSEIVSVIPVKGTNWMLACHANLAVIHRQMDYLYQKFLIGSLLFALVISGLGFWLIRIIYRKYDKEVNLQMEMLNGRVNELGILNQLLESRQQKNSSLPSGGPVPDQETVRKRILIYQKNEIISIDVIDISFISLDDNNVYIHTFQKQTYPSTSSLDDLMKQLDQNTFYRANRQYIINVAAVDSILVYGQNQLQLITRPPSREPIIISKNKVSEFKKWLDR